MSRRFDVTMFPAREGDCILVTYEGNDGRLHRMLVDGGRKATAGEVRIALSQLPEDERELEALVVTHVDRDHIEGILPLVEEPCPVALKDVWFNGYHHLHEDTLERFGAVQGERLSSWLQTGQPWNEAFGGKAVHVNSPTVTLGGGLTFRVLSPDRTQLKAMIPRWEKECAAAGLIPDRRPTREPVPAGLERMGVMDIAALAATRFEPDRKEPNGTTIALLVEHEGRRVLLGGDAHADRLVESIRPLAAASGGRLVLDAFKVPHHGSAGNLSTELLALLDCPRYLISTNGSYFKHPDREAIARIISHGGAEPELVFNYQTDQTVLWNVLPWQRRYGYRVTYPPAGQDGTATVQLGG